MNKGYLVKHSVDDILLGKKLVMRPGVSKTNQDFLAHVDICRKKVVDLLNDGWFCRLT